MPIKRFMVAEKLLFERSFTVKEVVVFEPADKDVIVAEITANSSLGATRSLCFPASLLYPLAGGGKTHANCCFPVEKLRI